MSILLVRSLAILSILFCMSQGQSLIKFVCQRNPSLDFCPSKRPAPGAWVTPPTVPRTARPFQPSSNRNSSASIPSQHNIDSFYSSRNRISEPIESMREEGDKLSDARLNTPTRFSSTNGGNEDRMASWRRQQRPTMSQRGGGVGVGSGFGIGIPGTGPIGVSSGLGVGVPGLGGGGGGLFGIGSTTGVSAPFVGNIGVSSGLGIG